MRNKEHLLVYAPRTWSQESIRRGYTLNIGDFGKNTRID